jgi:hypothetical protein
MPLSQTVLVVDGTLAPMEEVDENGIRHCDVGAGRAGVRAKQRRSNG